MKLIKTTLVATALTLISTSAFAGSQAESSTAPHVTTSFPSNTTAQSVKPAVLVNANPYGQKQRITRVVKLSPEKPVARDASTSADGKFVYKYGKNVKTKTFRPSVAKVDTMPNLFKN